MEYGTSLGFIALVVIVLVLGAISFMHKDDDIIHGAIKYGQPKIFDGDCSEGLFQVIMVTKARMEDKLDHNVVYGALGEDLVYVCDVAESITKNLVYGKFYECLVFKGKLGQVDYVELKGV